MSGYGHSSMSGLARWSAAGAVVVAAHFGGVWAAMNWQSHAAPAGDPPSAIQIDLAPLPVAANNAPDMAVAPGPELAEAKADDKPVESDEPPVETAEPPPEPVVQDEPVITPPEVEKKADVALPVMPKVDPVKEREKDKERERQRERQREVKRELDKKRELEREKKRTARAQAREADALARAQRTSAPSGGGPQAASAASTSAGSNSSAMASWRGALMAHLNRHKRASAVSSSGTVVVSFSISRSGAVTSARLARSSGDSNLDNEAVALVRRASPVPPPPDHIPGNAVSLSVPVRFSR